MEFWPWKQFYRSLKAQSFHLVYTCELLQNKNKYDTLKNWAWHLIKKIDAFSVFDCLTAYNSFAVDLENLEVCNFETLGHTKTIRCLRHINTLHNQFGCGAIKIKMASTKMCFWLFSTISLLFYYYQRGYEFFYFLTIIAIFYFRTFWYKCYQSLIILPEPISQQNTNLCTLEIF